MDNNYYDNVPVHAKVTIVIIYEKHIHCIPRSKKLWRLKLCRIWQITAIHQGFSNFYCFHNIPYANGLQFIKVFSAKLPTVLIRQTF